jgi:hypothetical protein
MLTDDAIKELKAAVHACNDARTALMEALDDAEAQDGDLATESSTLNPVGAALADWRDAQRQFMTTVAESGVSDPATAALLLKTNHGIDASNARCGIPGTDVDGADQPFPLDLSGGQGMLLTRAVTEHLE